MLTIRQVINNDKVWNGGSGNRAVGVAIRDLKADEDPYLVVDIVEKLKSGVRRFPNKYRILKDDIKKKPYGTCTRKGVQLKIVPLIDMEEVTE